MNLANFFSNDIINGKLFTNGQENSQFLILGVVLAVVWGILFAMFGYYFYNFKKVEAEQKHYGKGMLWTTFALSIVILIIWVMELVVFLNPGKLFGYSDSAGDAAYNTLIALVVVGFVTLVAVIVMMWFFLPSYGIAFDKNRILFMGESIPYARITKIIIDEKTHAIYVNYSVGKRTHKKQKFSLSTVIGAFMKENAHLTGKPVSNEDEYAYFKTLITTDKTAEIRNDQKIAEKQKNKKED